MALRGASEARQYRVFAFKIKSMAEERDLGGRPALFSTPELLESKVQEYFNQFNPEGDITPLNQEYRPTITGLCLFLGFESRQSFYDYEERRGFSYTIKKARMRIENQYELMLSSKNPAGSIFALKNLGWTDKQEVVSRNVNYNSELTQEEIKKISESLEDDV